MDMYDGSAEYANRIQDTYNSLFDKRADGIYTASVHVPKGWARIVESVCVKLEALDAPIKILQIKEKFGSLTIYVTMGSLRDNEIRNNMNNIINIAENKSSKTCCVCGSKGSIQNPYGWLLAVCDKHYTELKESKNK